MFPIIFNCYGLKSLSVDCMRFHWNSIFIIDNIFPKPLRDVHEMIRHITALPPLLHVNPRHAHHRATHILGHIIFKIIGHNERKPISRTNALMVRLLYRCKYDMLYMCAHICYRLIIIAFGHHNISAVKRIYIYIYTHLGNAHLRMLIAIGERPVFVAYIYRHIVCAVDGAIICTYILLLFANRFRWWSLGACNSIHKYKLGNCPIYKALSEMFGERTNGGTLNSPW